MNSCSRAPTLVNFSVTVSPGRTVSVRGEKVNSFIVTSIMRPTAGFPGAAAHATVAVATRSRATLRTANDETDMGGALLFAGIRPRAEGHPSLVERLSLVRGDQRSESALVQRAGALIAMRVGFVVR